MLSYLKANLLHFLFEMKLQKETAISVYLSSLIRFSDDGPQVTLSIIFEYTITIKTT